MCNYRYCLLFVLCLMNNLTFAGSEKFLSLADGKFNGWTIEEQKDTWHIGINPEMFTNPGDPQRYVVNSFEAGESKTGTLKSSVFTVEAVYQDFSICGWDGTDTGQNNGDRNYVLLRSWPDGEILRKTHVPGTNKLTPSSWVTGDLMGRKVYLEIVDNNPVLRRLQDGFAWIAFADYRQRIPDTAIKTDLYAVKIDDSAKLTSCRTIPFLAVSPQKRGQTRLVKDNTEIIPIGAAAKTLYLLGMINEGWDFGLAHWWEHMELKKKNMRDDQIYVGIEIGKLEIRYEDGGSDMVPLQIGATAWFVNEWAHGFTVGGTSQEPFLSRPDYMAIFRNSLKLHEDEKSTNPDLGHAHYYLAIKPRAKKIESIIIHDNTELRGVPLVSGITLSLQGKPTENLRKFENWPAERVDLEAKIDVTRSLNWSKDLRKLANALYTRESDLPKKVELLDFPKTLDAARISFNGDRFADMLSNIWVANLLTLDEKFEPNTGFFYESGINYPWYSGYMGIGVWAPMGVYRGVAYGRSSDHFATLAMRCLNNQERWVNYVDFCDKHLYFYRHDRDPNNGPDNSILDINKYPKDAPPHWGMGLNAHDRSVNEIPYDEEMDGHGSTIVGRWYAWRLFGSPKGEWLTYPRADVYGKSRWDSTREAAEFICWLMDYTNKDVMWSEGETTGWGRSGLVPPNMAAETDMVKIRKNYANCNHMYQPYPTYVCMTALRCSAQIADVVGKTAEYAKKWREYADRLQAGMLRELFEGDCSNRVWRTSPYSVYPSFQDSLVQAWFGIYLEGYDSKRWYPEMTEITRNTLRRQLSQEYGHAPALAMGYGMGWLMQSSLLMDHMDDAGKLFVNFARYVYDKNMDYVDKSRGIDWRKWLWLIPEGTNILPDGSWYRIGDLTNGANQGPPMHAIELCAGIDDTRPEDLRVMPRVPDPMIGIKVQNFLVLVPDKTGLSLAKVDYDFNKTTASFSLRSNQTLPKLSIHLGPFNHDRAMGVAKICQQQKAGSIRTEKSGSYREQDAWWVWVEGLKDINGYELKAKL